MKAIKISQLSSPLCCVKSCLSTSICCFVSIYQMCNTIYIHSQSLNPSQPCEVVTCAPPCMHMHVQAVYTSLREAEYRSTAFVPYWNVPLLRAIVPRQRRCTEALKIINATLDGLIQRCKDLVEEEEQEFVEEFVGQQDPSILHFLLASGDQVGPDATLCNHPTALVCITR